MKKIVTKFKEKNILFIFDEIRASFLNVVYNLWDMYVEKIKYQVIVSLKSCYRNLKIITREKNNY